MFGAHRLGSDLSANNLFHNFPFSNANLNTGALTGALGLSWVQNDTFQWKFNVTTAFELSRLCAPYLAEKQDGAILNISSVAGEKPTPCFSAYGTAKGALSLLTRELAQEFAPRIRVNAIAVGSTRTDALNTVLTQEVEQTMVELTPMGRLGEVEDIALGAVYLCPPAASYVTGDILGINGGLERLNMQMPRAWGGMG